MSKNGHNFIGLLKKSPSGVLGPLSNFALFAPFALTYLKYAVGAKAPAALPVEKGVSAHLG